MRITVGMINAVRDQVGSDVDPEYIGEALKTVYPLIAEQAAAGYIEQGARLKEAERLLARARQILINGRTADEIGEWLAT